MRHVRWTRRSSAACILFLASALTPVAAVAQDATWKGPGSAYDDSSNWSPAVVPTNRATFGTNGPTDVSVTNTETLGELLFPSGAQAFRITNSGNFTINGIGTDGIANQSSNGQLVTNLGNFTFNNGATVSGAALLLNNLGTIAFNDNSGVSHANFQNSGGDALATGVTVTGVGAAGTFNDHAHADGILIVSKGGSATATGTGGAADAVGGTANLAFGDDSHADNTLIINDGGGGIAKADTDSATATGASATISFTGNAHADGATFNNFAGAAGGIPQTTSAGSIATGGDAILSFSDAAHADHSNIVSRGGLADGIGGNADDAGHAGGTTGATAGNALVTFSGSSHADNSQLSNRGGDGQGFGGAGGQGAPGQDGGAGGTSIGLGGDATITFRDSTHANGSKISNTAGASVVIAGDGGAAGGGHAGGQGGGSSGFGGGATVQFTDSAQANGVAILNSGGQSVLKGGDGGTGGATVGGGGSGGDATGVGGTAKLIFSGSASLGTGASIMNLGGNATAAGGKGGTGDGANGGNGGGATAAGGDAVVTFDGNASAGDAQIVNQSGKGNAIGGDGGAGGATGNGGNGGFASARGGNAFIIFSGNSTAGSAVIQNIETRTFALTGGNSGSPGAAGRGGTGGGASDTLGLAQIIFNNNSTGGNAHILNQGGSVFFNDASVFGTATPGGVAARIDNSVGLVEFHDGSSLGSGTIVNGGASIPAIVFLDNATAGTGSIVNGAHGLVSFGGSSTAGSATISNDALGAIVFGDSSNAGSASIANSGFLQLAAHADAVGATIVNASGGIVDLAALATGTRIGSLSGAGNVQLGNAALEVGALGRDDVIAGVISDTGSLTKTGSGTLILTGANSYTGGTVVNGGALQIGDGGTTGSIVGDVIDNALVAFARADDVTYGNVISGTGALAKSGAGTLILTGANSYAGGTLVAAGTLQIGNGGTTGAIAGNVVDNGALVFNRSDGSTFSGDISGTGTLTKAGAGTLILTGNAGQAGGTIVSGGTLQIGDGGTAGTIAGNILDNANVAFDRSDIIGFNGAISGTGSLTKTGAGTLVLTSGNSYTGGTTISQGVLQIGNGGTAGAIGGDVTDNANLTFDRSDDIAFGGLVSGIGSLTKLGAGTLTLLGSDSYAGGTTIAAGTLQIGNGGTAGSIAGNVVDNSNLAFNRSDTIAFGGAISGTGSLTKAGTGTLVLTNANSYSGGTTIAAGTLQIGNGGTTGSIVGNVVDNANLTFNRSDSISFGGAISGSGSLTKAGTGVLTLAGASTYAGPTSVNAGVLQLDGSITSNTNIAAAGTLRGTGRIAGNLVNNGILAPGSSAAPFGILTVTGNFTSNAGALLALTIDGAGHSGLVQAGSATLNGGAVRPQAVIGSFFLMQTDYRIATGTGGLTGTFSGGVDESLLPVNLDASLLYTATDALLRIRRNATSFAATTGLTPNQGAIAAALDAGVSGGSPSVFTTYLATYNNLLTAGSALPQDLDRLSGDALTALPVAAQGAAERFGDRLESHTWSNSSNLWGLVAYGDQKVDGDGNAPGFDAGGAEVQLGLASSLGPDTRLGLSAGWTHSNVDIGGRGASADVDSWSAGARLRQDLGGVYLAGQATYSRHKIDTARALLLAGPATARFHARTWTVAGEVGGVIRAGQLSIEPFAGVRHAGTSTDSYTETGGAGALAVARADYDTTRIGLGLRLANRQHGATLRPTVLIGYERELGDRQVALDNDLPGLPGFRVAGSRLGRDVLTAKLGLEAQVGRNVSLFVDGGGRWRSNESDLHANGGIRIVF